MSTTVIDLIGQVREDLADVNSDRWSDVRLVDILNDGIKDLVLEANLLQGVVYVELDINLSTYDVSDKLLGITRAQYNEGKIPLMSHREMDKVSTLWQQESGADVRVIVYDKQDRGMFRIYPKIEDASNIIESNSNYGILISFDISYTPSYLNLEELPLTSKYLSIYGVKRPEVMAIDSTMELDEQWDKTLKHYIVGTAFRSDQDVGNRSLGNEELQMYGAKVLKARKDRANSSTSATKQTGYRKT